MIERIIDWVCLILAAASALYVLDFTAAIIARRIVYGF
jgi:hypothetical protein